MIWFYLLSGLFLGWSLGANNTANIFGAAVSSRMVRFRVAAIVASIGLMLGSFISGAGVTRTLGELGAVNAIAGSFVVAFASGIAVTWMTELKLPVSTSQAIVGGIIGWNLFTGSPNDAQSIIKILTAQIMCPLLAAGLAFVLYSAARIYFSRFKVHILREDAFTRGGLVFVGFLGAYALGANNISNVMGVFVSASPFSDLSLGFATISGTQILFLIGGAAIALGVFTFSEKTMKTVGSDLFKLTPIAALISVCTEAIVLWLFSSQSLEQWLYHHGLPTIPLAPVSSSQAIIGAVVGIGLTKGGKGIRYEILGKIGLGWILTPVVALLATFLGLFIFQNVFELKVVHPIEFRPSIAVERKLEQEGISPQGLVALRDRTFLSPALLRRALRPANYSEADLYTIFSLARWDSVIVDSVKLLPMRPPVLSYSQYRSLMSLNGDLFLYRWQMFDSLASISPSWRLSKAEGSERKNKYLIDQEESVISLLRSTRDSLAVQREELGLPK